LQQPGEFRRMPFSRCLALVHDQDAEQAVILQQGSCNQRA